MAEYLKHLDHLDECRIPSQDHISKAHALIAQIRLEIQKTHFDVEDLDSSNYWDQRALQVYEALFQVEVLASVLSADYQEAHEQKYYPMNP